jgi:hypothetical protein
VIVDCETTGKAGMDAFVAMADFAKNQRLSWSGIVMLMPAQSDWAERVTQDDQVAVLVKPITMRQLREHVQRMVPMER